jgi:hypothetical protein
MDEHSDPTKNLNFILLDDVSHLPSSNDEINNSINGNRFAYNFDASETFSDTSLLASSSINVVYNHLKQAFNPTESSNSTYDSKNDDDDDDEQLAMNTSNTVSLPVTRAQTETLSKPSIFLSNSVAITNSKSRQLQLVYPLEKTYRARYKSDYFPQTGSVRRPRYIADSATNHFITLQLPTEYQHDLQNSYIRVALTTKLIKGHGYYYSPYKFQKDHNDIKIPDENPIYIKVETSREDNFVIRLQLVLIKSKSDQLNDVQPLKIFSDSTTQIQNIVHDERLTPKELITRYQLDQSHIAFTLCTKLPDGFYEVHPETTIMSSVITEVSTSRKTNDSATPSVDLTPNICCPHCAYHFDPDTPSGSDERNNPKSTNSKTSRSRSKTTTEKRSNKKKKNA